MLFGPPLCGDSSTKKHRRASVFYDSKKYLNLLRSEVGGVCRLRCDVIPTCVNRGGHRQILPSDLSPVRALGLPAF